MFREDQMKAVIGEWTVEVGCHKRRFKVNYANTFDEPVGTWKNRTA
jgi:hypothetical protein